MISNVQKRVVDWYHRHEMPVLVAATLVLGVIALVLLIGAVTDSVILYKEF